MKRIADLTDNGDSTCLADSVNRNLRGFADRSALSIPACQFSPTIFRSLRILVPMHLLGPATGTKTASCRVLTIIDARRAAVDPTSLFYLDTVILTVHFLVGRNAIPSYCPKSGSTRPMPSTKAAHNRLAQVKQQHCQIGRGDATHAARLPDVGRSNPRQLLTGFTPQLRNRGVVEVRRNRPRRWVL